MKQAAAQLYKIILSVSNDEDLTMATTGRNMQSFGPQYNMQQNNSRAIHFTPTTGYKNRFPEIRIHRKISSRTFFRSATAQKNF